MSIKEDGGVKKWAVRLAELGVIVPDEFTPQAMQQLLKDTSDDPLKQHAAAHYTLHVHTALRCEQSEAPKQAGQSDQKSEQAA